MSLNTEKIRAQLAIIAPPGPMSSFVLKIIIEEAERYAAENATKSISSTQGSIEYLSIVKDIKETLQNARRTP